MLSSMEHDIGVLLEALCRRMAQRLEHLLLSQDPSLLDQTPSSDLWHKTYVVYIYTHRQNTQILKKITNFKKVKNRIDYEPRNSVKCIISCIWEFWLHVYLCMSGAHGGHNRCQTSWNLSYTVWNPMCMLGIKPGSSATPACTLNQCAISPCPDLETFKVSLPLI